ncbi:MAG: glycoside hydrolase family 25 protein [Lachnospiraceae bacterium]|nr:glycoside hydrolase family 25 protein [Lachnospiraceae bacterium]
MMDDMAKRAKSLEEAALTVEDAAQLAQMTEDLRSLREKVKFIKGDISAADGEVKSMKKRLEELGKNKGKNLFRTVAAVELVCLLVVGTSFFVYHQVQKGKTIPVGSGDVTPTPLTIPDGKEKEGAENRFLVTDLKERVAAMQQSQIAPFVATVEQVDGREALCFTQGKLRIVYWNEYPQEEEETKLRLENGGRLFIRPWEYNLAGKLELLAPKFGAYAGTEGNQLVFLQYADAAEQIPQRICMMDGERLWEYSELNLKEALSDLFTTEYAEGAAVQDGHSNTYMTMTVGAVPYQYEISQGTYTNAVYNGEKPLLFDQYFVLELAEEKMSFSAVVYTPQGEYLGEVSGEIAAVDRDIVLKNVKFGAYVTPYQEDPGSTGIIVPREGRMTEHITISGKNKQRYYIALSDEVARVDYDMERLIQNGNGFFEYFDENGNKISRTGIDVSKYQGDINWKLVKDAGVDYAIIRLGYRGMNEGTLELDPYFEANIAAANEAGLDVGVYFFSQAITVEEAVEEANMVLEHIKDYKLTYPVIFDTEVVTTYNARANNLARDLRTDICIAFCDTIEAAGYRPMVYANTRWMILGIDLERLTKYDKWYAYYGTTFTFPYKYQMLQYSDSGKVPGISGAVDLDISFVDYSKQ